MKRDRIELSDSDAIRCLCDNRDMDWCPFFAGDTCDILSTKDAYKFMELIPKGCPLGEMMKRYSVEWDQVVADNSGEPVSDKRLEDGDDSVFGECSQLSLFP